LLQGTSKFHYKNIRIVKNNGKFSYWGVTHEYIQMPDDAIKESISKNMIFIDDIGDGGAKNDKFIRDIRLLKQGLTEHPNNDRYTFYLANSYKDSNQYTEAIETYKKRIQIGGWKQEVWYSYYCIGLCYKHLNNMESAIGYWLQGYNYLPERIENIYEIINYYRCIGNNNLVDVFYNMAKNSSKSINQEDQLFFKKDVYDYKLDYEFSIAGYYSNQHNIDMNKVFMNVLNYPLDNKSLNNTLSNYKFYVKSLNELKLPNSRNIQLLSDISFTKDYPELYSSTPTICYSKTNNKLYTNTRLVNYFIDKDGSYKYKNSDNSFTANSTIITKNIIRVYNVSNDIWEEESRYELKYNKQYDGLYVGLEDVRLLTNKLGICFNANRGISYGKIMIETGTIDIKSQNTESSLVYKDNLQNVEKNWVLFNTVSERVKVIYKWYPLTIGEYMLDENDKTIFFTTNTIDTPVICKLMRGSTNGVTINNEIWFITHYVSHESLRYYYHMFVVLDIETFKMKRYSIPFTFEKNRIEYTLGFVFNEKTNNFIIGYSTMDRTTNYMEIAKENIDKLFI